jgi:hypothetical protein
MSFTPAGGYHWLLAGAVLAVCVLIAAAAWPPRFRPRRLRFRPRRFRPRRLRFRPPRLAADPGGPPAGLRQQESGTGAGSGGPVGYWLAATAAAVVLALVGGPVAAAVPATVLLGWWRPRWVPWLAFTAMCAAGVLAMTGLSHGTQTGFGSFAWPAQAMALIALAAALTPPGPWPRRRPAAAVAGEGDDE